jgi:glycosyltransferase involved in cell wall biosynthesis
LTRDPSDIDRAAVVVVHPGVQHSRELARALHEGGLLARFITSSDGRFGGSGWLPERLQHRMRLRSVGSVPRELVSTFPYPEAAAWIAGKLAPASISQRLGYGALALFDRMVSRRAIADAPRIVVGVENSCLATFRRAKEAGALCVLDAAAVHFRSQPDEEPAAAPGFRRTVERRKESELRLADHLVVLSSYARETYVAAGFEARRISVIPPGAWLPALPPGRAAPRERRGMRFLFAGNVKRAKGVDLLLRAFSRLAVPGKELVLAGSLTDVSLLPRPLPDNVQVRGRLARQELFAEFALADALVLPSRADGFGFVVAEAMASGLPAIVSSATGARDLIAHGTSGWIFESGNDEELLQVMESVAQQRQDLEHIGRQAARAVQGLTWDRYGASVRDFYGRLLSAGGSPR